MRYFLFFIIILPINSYALTNYDKEKTFLAYQQSLKNMKVPSVCHKWTASLCDYKILIDAWIELIDKQYMQQADIDKLWQSLPHDKIASADIIRLQYYLQDNAYNKLPDRFDLALQSERDELTACLYLSTECRATVYGSQMPDMGTLKDLVFHTPSADEFQGGKYKEGIRLFMLCRQNRKYPCLFLLKDKWGNFYSREDGSLWTMPSLGLSKKGRPSYKTDGHTPAGVHTIDGVMPYADKNFRFGDYRRLILNFVPKNTESMVLPESSHDHTWWQEAVVARDIGRAYLRIHGTGQKNWNPFSKHHPFVATRGCVATREGKYGDQKYKDQRRLLDTLMLASGLEPKYENETKLHGLLYVVNIDDEEHAVSEEDVMEILSTKVAAKKY
mgnify:CR=1 FL=1|tara:strand:+ start:2553 stop:3710 length:1158 start_codon:yes stop_codon:yes gene_type:complete